MKRATGALRGDHVATVKARIVVAESGCWEYQGTRLPGGYGQVGRNKMAHRVMWEAVRGPIPEGLQLDHLCRNRICVNPDHLEPVTCRENLLRGEGFSATNAVKTHCAHGHEFTEANTYYRPDRFGRICRTCRDEGLRRHREANRERIAATARASRKAAA